MPDFVRAASRLTADSVFPPDVAMSLLARRPYDLRHAAVSTWLNAGVPPTDVAEWAGQSVEILLRVYAKCLDGGLATLQARIDAAMDVDDEKSS